MSTTSVEQQQFVTDDPEQGHEYLRRMYTQFTVKISGVEDRFRMSADLVRFGATSISRIRHSMAAAVDVGDGMPSLGVMRSYHPSVGFEADRRRHPVNAGNAIVLRPGTPYRVFWNHLDIDMTTLDHDLVADAAAGLDVPAGPVEFDFDTAVSPIAAAQWRQVLSLVRRVALANAGLPHGALLAGELSQLLSTTALTCFRNSTMRDTTVGSTRTVPASLGRAISYIESHLDQPLTLTSVAEAARVSPRALNETFHRHQGTSPMGYVRRARLDRAHHDLTAARPGDQQTVTGIAARWGFYSLPRFGVAYRRAYGQPPSQTLRRDHPPRGRAGSDVHAVT